MISEHDLANIDRIIGGYGDWFTAHLLRLMHKADQENFTKLAHAFPDVGAAYLMWKLDSQLPQYDDVRQGLREALADETVEMPDLD